MYLRWQRRAVNGVTCESWTLVASRRTASGPRQHPVAVLGKLPGLEEQVHAGWESIDALLRSGAPARQLEFSGPPPPPAPPLWREVGMRGGPVERGREFGQAYLARGLWRRLGLHTLLTERIPSGREEVPWEPTACLLTLARFCAQPSELGVAERKAWAARAQGAHRWRTDCAETDAAQVWQWYLPLQQAEAALRCAKGDWSLGPIFQHKTARVEAHLLVGFLSRWRCGGCWNNGGAARDWERARGHRPAPSRRSARWR